MDGQALNELLLAYIKQSPRTAGLLSLGFLLGKTGKPALAARLMEVDIGLKRSDYRNQAQLARKLQRCFAKMEAEPAALYIAVLATNLALVDRRSEALAVIECDTQLSHADYADPILLAEKIHARLPV
jgi:hypothetical protein